MRKLLTLFLGLASSLCWSAVEIRLFGYGGTDISAMNRFLEEVVQPEVAESNIKISYHPVAGNYSEYIEKAIRTKSPPDLFYLQTFESRPLIDSGFVLDLSGLVPASLTEDISPNLIKSFTYDKKLYGVAKDFNTLALQFNKDIFEEAGVEFPSDKDTWDTFTQKLRQLKSKLKNVHGLCAPIDFARFGAFAFSSGWAPFNDEGHTVLDSNFREAFIWYQNLIKEGIAILPEDIGVKTGASCLASEEVAVSIEGAWVGGYIAEHVPDLRFGSTRLPINPRTKKRGNFLFTVAWAISKNTAHPEASIKVLEALTSTKAQLWVLDNSFAIPSRQSLVRENFFKDDTPIPNLNRAVYEGLSDAHVYPFEFRGFGTEWTDLINSTLTDVILEGKTPDQAIVDVQIKLDNLTGRK